ncbi:MAG: dihydrofolate reductase family protein [Acidobacteriaceae bacterium]
MKLSVFCGVSVDGFLARPDHALDFLDTPEQGPHGFDEFFSSVDVVLIGRRTFDVVLSFSGPWGYGPKPVFVLTHRPPDFSSLKGAVIEAISGEPRAVAAQLEACGYQHVYVDGGLTIQQFLAAGLIDRLIVTRVPVLIGEGIPLFGRVPHDIPLTHVATHAYKGGLVQTEYEIDRSQRTPAKKKTAKAPLTSRKAKR